MISSTSEELRARSKAKKRSDKMILAMLKKGKYGHEEIAEIAEVSVSYLYIEEEGGGYSLKR